MLENPGDELYFGEVYRTVLQEAWLPGGAEIWQRTGISRRGRRPTQQGLYPRSPTQAQSAVRVCFSKCVGAWNALPWDNPTDLSCDNSWGKEHWKQEKQDRGLMCSYYDVFMKFCLPYCFDTGCVPPQVYLLQVHPTLKDIKCNKVYDLTFPNKCGDVSMSWGDGQFTAPSAWRSPKCGTDGQLCFQDETGSLGSIYYDFAPEFACTEYIWSPENPVEINPNESLKVYVEGGVGPYNWSVTGEGFSLTNNKTQVPSNTLHAGPAICVSANITVLDSCDNSCQGLVRGANQYIGDEPAYAIYKYPNPCSDPAAFCHEESAWEIPRPKVLRYRCDGTFLDETRTCSGASCVGELCICATGEGFSYTEACNNVYNGCNGYDGHFWGQYKDLRTQEMIDAGCCPGAIP